MNEHEQKYDKLAKLLGWEEIKALIPVPLDQVLDALNAGDEHLNSISLIRWDRAALGQDLRGKKITCPHCKQTRNIPPPRHGCGGKLRDLFRKHRLSHSLADGVCLLKHVARVEAEKLREG